MERKSLKLPFKKAGVTRYTCPTCSKGHLKVVDTAFHYRELKKSKDAHREEWWEPEWIRYIYTALLECTDAACKEIVASSGTGGVQDYYSYDEQGNTEVDYQELFTPKYFEPPLNIFPVSETAPELVQYEIETSFALIFSDPASAANHIRIALEHILTALKVRRYSTKNRKRGFLSLHNRIELLPAKYHHIKDLMLAIKWLGNAGSHSNNRITIDDVLDAYELTEEVLAELYPQKVKNAKALAKEINKRKGPKKS